MKYTGNYGDALLGNYGNPCKSDFDKILDITGKLYVWTEIDISVRELKLDPVTVTFYR